VHKSDCKFFKTLAIEDRRAMRIGFDGKRAMFNFTGLGNYSRYVLEILSKYYPENEYDVFVSKKRDNQRMEKLLSQYPDIKMKYASSWGKMLPSLWRTYGMTGELKKSNIDIYHGLSNELPANIVGKGIKTVVTIHDLIFLRFPECYPLIDRKIYAHKFRKACIDSDRIIAVSECTKKDIVKLFDIPEEKITVIYQGCDRSFTIPATEERKITVRDKYQLPQRYILNVGSIEKRKNALLAVKAMEKIHKDIHLVIVGRRTEYAAELEKYASGKGLKDRIHIKDNVSFADLPAVYQQAELFVYPSIYEGFGIPIVEALNSGIPVIATRDSCLEEAGGPSSIYIESDDVEALINAETQILYTSKLRQNMINDGREYAERFSEEIQAENLIRLYEEVIHS
jgi:glycosyltransferase involved in cell wall biosynthesis